MTKIEPNFFGSIYHIKAPITGWHEVDKEHFERFVDHIRESSTSPNMTRDELVKKLTKIEK